MQYLFLQQALLDSDLELFRAPKAVAHGWESDIEREADHELAVADITSALDYILDLNIECGRIINLLEVACEVPLVIVLPLDEAADLVSEFRIAYIAPSLVHCALVAALLGRHFGVIE